MRKYLLIILMLAFFATSYGQKQESVVSSSNIENIVPQKEPEIKIFPVPVISNHFTITSDTPFIFIRMTNIIGQEITREKINYPVSRREVTFKSTEKGIYLITIELEDHRKIIRKILVNN